MEKDTFYLRIWSWGCQKEVYNKYAKLVLHLPMLSGKKLLVLWDSINMCYFEKHGIRVSHLEFLEHMANYNLKCSISSDNTEILTIPGLSQVPGSLGIIFLRHSSMMLQKKG